jgi:hypothetical protein
VSLVVAREEILELMPRDTKMTGFWVSRGRSTELAVCLFNGGAELGDRQVECAYELHDGGPSRVGFGALDAADAVQGDVRAFGELFLADARSVS